MIPYRARPVRRVPLTALVDVVFILLFFFMLASSLDDPRHIPVALAGAGAASDARAATGLRLEPGQVNLGGAILADADALARLSASPPAEIVLDAVAGVDMQRLADWLQRLDRLGIEARLGSAP